MLDIQRDLSQAQKLRQQEGDEGEEDEEGEDGEEGEEGEEGDEGEDEEGDEGMGEGKVAAGGDASHGLKGKDESKAAASETNGDAKTTHYRYKWHQGLCLHLCPAQLVLASTARHAFMFKRTR